MTLAEMRQELRSRFKEFIADGRTTRLLNESYHDLLERHAWPFLETTTTGTAPLTISDLRQVFYVVDTTNNRSLRSIDPRDLVGVDPDLDDTGSPESFWLDGLTTLRVHPLNTTASLSVRYLKVAADLALDADAPILPARFHMLIVDAAQVRALAEGPNPQQSDHNRMAVLEQSLERKVQRMCETLLVRNLDGPEYMSVQFASEDW